jgi:membrane-bound inhibitor of C-type lysozyme
MINISAERTSILLAVLGLALVSCSSPQATNSEGTLATFTCPTGETITAVFASDPADSVTVTLPEQTAIALPRVEAASGAKYSDGTTTFWEKGGEAMVEVNGEITLQSCTAE